MLNRIKGYASKGAGFALPALVVSPPPVLKTWNIASSETLELPYLRLFYVFRLRNTEADAFAILDTFVEAGGNLIDTADVYVGASRKRSSDGGSAARPRDVTDRVVLASEGRFGGGQDVNAVGLSRRRLRRALNASLRRLGVETIDLYQLHASDMHTPVEETLLFLDEAVALAGNLPPNDTVC